MDKLELQQGSVTLSGSEWLALALGGVLLLAAGAWHLVGLLAIKHIGEALGLDGPFAVLLAFWGLSILHLSEIAIGAAVYGVSIYWLDLGSVEQGYGGSAGGLLYLSGISFATLGYSQQVVDGPLRLMTMLNSLGGFMLITWSATYVYSIWGEQYRERDDD